MSKEIETGVILFKFITDTIQKQLNSWTIRILMEAKKFNEVYIAHQNAVPSVRAWARSCTKE